MLLPNSYALSFALMALCLLCWGSWATTFKKSGWRFELFYFDFSLGAVIAAVVAAFTVGSMGEDITVQDSFLLVSKRPILLAFFSGVVFNLGNMLLLGAVEVAGMSVAFPIGIGLALIVTITWNYFLQLTANPFFLFGGCLLVLIAVILTAVAHGQIETLRRKLAAEKAAAEAPPEEPIAAPTAAAAAAIARRKKQQVESGPSKFLGVWLALAGGLLLGCFQPVVAMSTGGELDFANPFAVTMIASVGIFFSTFIYNLYFLNLPVKGEPLSFFAYFTGKLGQHALGLIGGILWMAGACAFFAANFAQGEAKLPPTLTHALVHGSALISLLWGLLVWKEFAVAASSTSKLLTILTVLFLGGLGLIAFAPLS